MRYDNTLFSKSYFSLINYCTFCILIVFWFIYYSLLYRTPNVLQKSVLSLLGLTNLSMAKSFLAAFSIPEQKHYFLFQLSNVLSVCWLISVCICFVNVISGGKRGNCKYRLLNWDCIKSFFNSVVQVLNVYSFLTASDCYVGSVLCDVQHCYICFWQDGSPGYDDLYVDRCIQALPTNDK